jgi:hypothetical protein
MSKTFLSCYKKVHINFCWRLSWSNVTHSINSDGGGGWSQLKCTGSVPSKRCFYTADLDPPYGFLWLENFAATAKIRRGLGFLTLFLCLPLKVALFFLFLLLFIYNYIFSPQKQNLEMHRKEESLTENNATLMVSEIYTKISINDENSSLFKNSILGQRQNQR